MSSFGEATLVGSVARLVLYPVKSMAGIEVNQLDCQMSGPQQETFSDRQFMVTRGEENTFFTARQEPRLLLIQPEVISNKLLRLSVAGKESVDIDLDVVEKQRNIQKTIVQGFTTVGLDCGNDVAAWIDSFLGKSTHRLFYACSSIDHRPVNGGSVKYAPWTANIDNSIKMNYQDSSPFHILSQSSVDDLNAKLSVPVSTDNFRANIIVSGSAAFSEDTWNKVYIGNTEMSFIKPCSRCILTTMDPATGTKLQEDQPLKALRTYRKIVPSFGESPCLGINLVLDRVGTISVGDPIYAVIGPPRLTP